MAKGAELTLLSNFLEMAAIEARGSCGSSRQDNGSSPAAGAADRSGAHIASGRIAARLPVYFEFDEEALHLMGTKPAVTDKAVNRKRRSTQQIGNDVTAC